MFFLQLIISGFAIGCLYALVALGFVLIYKATEILNFANGEFLLVGAFTCYMLITRFSLPFYLSFMITMGVALIFGLLVERVVLRPMIGEPIFAVVMITIGLSIFLRAIFGIIFGHENKIFPSPFSETPINLSGIVVSYAQLWIIVASGLLIVLFFLFFKYTRVGLAMRGVANNQSIAMLMGISVKRVFGLTWGLAAIIAAIGGIFLSNVMVLNLGLSLVAIKVFPAVILGGLESIPGAIIGGIVIGIVETLAGGYLGNILPGVKELTAFVILFLVLMVRPYGLFGKEEIERV